MIDLFCVVCHARLDNVSENGIQPNHGLQFLSYGHYGTTVFDPMDGSKISICICDSCLEKSIDAELVHHISYPEDDGIKTMKRNF